MTEGFLEQIGDVQTLVGLEQLGQGTAAVQRQIGAVGKQRVFLSLDKLAALAREPGILALAHLVQRVPQMAHHMELVEEDAGFGNMLQSAVTKGFPHVHDRQVNAPGFLDPPLLEEQVQALL